MALKEPRWEWIMIKTFTSFKTSQFVLFWLFVRVRGSIEPLSCLITLLSTESTENQHTLTYWLLILYIYNVENVNNKVKILYIKNNIIVKSL